MTPSPQEHVSLLLLPALHLRSTTSSLRSAYKSTFETLLPRLISRTPASSISRLDVAIVLSPSYPITSKTSRSALFSPIQRLLEQTYSLICAVAARQKVELDFPGGLDVRVFLLEARLDHLPPNLIGKQVLSGPIVDIETFVRSDRGYTTLYSVEGETGEVYLKTLITSWHSKHKTAPPVVRLPSGPAIAQEGTSLPEAPIDDRPLTTHASVAVGGTFDHLHIGHKLLLTATILTAEPSKPRRLITVGITGDALLANKKYGSVVESWEIRQQRTASFIESILAFHPGIPSIKSTTHIDEPGPNGKVVRVTYGSGPDEITINYTLLLDAFGPTITDPEISALVISGETRAGGKAVNDKRAEKGWSELEVFEVDVLDAGVGLDDDGESDGGKKEKQSFDSKISSTEIRRRLQQRAEAEG